MDEQRDFDRFLQAVDLDGAIAETSHQRKLTLSRGGLIAGAAAGAGALLLGGSEARAASGLSANDVGILNYALVLEYLQASFYTEAERSGALSGKTAQAAQVVGATERAHVKAFQKLLGAKAVKRPLFDFQGVTEAQQAFLKTAVAFEDLAVAAYKGQAPRLQSNAVLAAAVGIHSVEARHAAWVRELFGITPAVNAFDKPATKQNVDRIVASTHFIVAHPKMKARSKPQYTG
jgi:Ferritin-like domain